jgi:hypothetical protein
MLAVRVNTLYHGFLVALELKLSRDSELSVMILLKFEACYKHYATM